MCVCLGGGGEDLKESIVTLRKLLELFGEFPQCISSKAEISSERYDVRY